MIHYILISTHDKLSNTGGGFKYFVFSRLPGGMMKLDEHFLYVKGKHPDLPMNQVQQIPLQKGLVLSEAS